MQPFFAIVLSFFVVLLSACGTATPEPSTAIRGLARLQLTVEAPAVTAAPQPPPSTR